MKKILSSLLLVAAFGFVSPLLTDIINAMKAGNAEQISKYFDTNVEITFPGKSNSYSKSQAKLVITDFFTLNPVKNFEVLHKSDKAGSQYCIGNLETANGIFRTTIFLKERNGMEVIQELRFEQ